MSIQLNNRCYFEGGINGLALSFASEKAKNSYPTLIGSKQGLFKSRVSAMGEYNQLYGTKNYGSRVPTSAKIEKLGSY